MSDGPKTLAFSFRDCETDQEKIQVVVQAVAEIMATISDGEDLDLCEVAQGVAAGCLALQIDLGHGDCARGWLDRATKLVSTIADRKLN